MKQNIEIKQINPDKKNRLKLLFSKISIDRGLVLKVGLPVFILLLLMAIFAVFPLINLYRKAQFLKGLESRFKTAIEKQDIGIVSSEIDRTKSQLTEFKGAYYSLAWTKVLPLVGGYWRDGEKMLKAAFYGLEASEITLGTIKPYADIIGFAPGGKEAQSGEESAQDRMEFVISTLDAVLPKLASITERVEKANNELKSIDVSKYPEPLETSMLLSSLFAFSTLSVILASFGKTASRVLITNSILSCADSSPLWASFPPGAKPIMSA